MATGMLPFRGDTSALIFKSILDAAPVPVVRLNPDVPTKLEDIIGKALEKDRSLRYQHASEMRSDLQRLKRDTDTQRIPIPATEADAFPGAKGPSSPIQSATTTREAANAGLVPKRAYGKIAGLVAVIAFAMVALLFWQLRHRATPAASPHEPDHYRGSSLSEYEFRQGRRFSAPCLAR